MAIKGAFAEKPAKVLKIPVHTFLKTMRESCGNGRRFCYILGAGASRQSGIPTGVELARRWVDELKERYTENPQELRWLMEALGVRGLEPTSRNYFDIYTLRFFSDYYNGYARLEREMEAHQPSYGYYPLAMQLTGGVNNLVITTNFDSLIEDALFLYSDKKPIVVDHELLADYINVKETRPLIAKIHRGLFFHPLNRSDELSEIKENWKAVLRSAFQIFTPIVIGYAGGDHSLMDFLQEEDVKMDGLYWCLLQGEEPSPEIRELVEKKGGHFVIISGFDEMMYQLAAEFGYEDPTPRIEASARERVELYQKQQEEFEHSLSDIPNPTQEQQELQSLVNNSVRRALDEAQQRIIENPNDPAAYIRMARACRRAKDYEGAVKWWTKAIGIDSNCAEAYQGRGFDYDTLAQYERALVDYGKALELNPNSAALYNNRGYAYARLEKRDDAIMSYTTAIELNPNYGKAYNNRGCTYAALGEYQLALADYNRAIELKPDYAYPYCHRGWLFHTLGEDLKALEDLDYAIELEPDYETAYRRRGQVHEALGDMDAARADFAKADALKAEDDPEE